MKIVNLASYVCWVMMMGCMYFGFKNLYFTIFFNPKKPSSKYYENIFLQTVIAVGIILMVLVIIRP